LRENELTTPNYHGKTMVIRGGIFAMMKVPDKQIFMKGWLQNYGKENRWRRKSLRRQQRRGGEGPQYQKERSDFRYY
jgi:hypothetical protein